MPSKSPKFKLVHRIPNSNILIDFWKSASQDKYYRFMTFLRIGSDDSSIKDMCESSYTIYTSLFNKWYLITYYQVSEHRIIELRENETLTIRDDQSNPVFTVTAFDANYYTGSLMFLFQGPFGNVLYTGFFRPSSFDSIFESPVLKSLAEKRELDVAYVDNTYAAEHCEFPSRSEILDQIVTCLRQHPKHKVAISGKRLGKEEILLDIAKALDEKIHVSEEKFVILSRLNLQNHFTTDKKRSRIFACDYIISPKECSRMQAEEGPYIIILLTAFYHCNRMCNNEEFITVPGLYIFPYSGHCSHSELVRFISFLKPRDVQPLIKFVRDEHSVIPQSIFKLCHKPTNSLESGKQTSSLESQTFCSCKSNSSEKFYSCETGASQTTSSSATTMITVYNPTQRQEIIDNAINELKSFNGVDEFLESGSGSDKVDNFSQNVVESVLNVDIGDVSANLHDAVINTLLSSSDTSNDADFYANAKASSSRSNQPTDSSSHIKGTDVQNLGCTNLTNNVTVVSEIQLPFHEPEPAKTQTFRKTVDSITSSSYTPQDQVHSTKSYEENYIAENVISSTNNDSLPEISSPILERKKKKKRTGSISVTVGDVDIDIRSDLDLQDMTDREDPPEIPCISNELRVEKQQPVLSEKSKKLEEKSVQTDWTLETVSQMEKRNGPKTTRNEAEPMVIGNEVSPANEDVSQLMAKYISKNKRSVFDTDRYFGKSCNKRGLEICTSESCRDCRAREEQIKKRKLISNTLYNAALTLGHNISPSKDQICSSLKGYGLRHPMYKDYLKW